MRFLTGSKIQTHVKKIARRTDALMAAVAYWGTGAAERTGLTRSKKPENVRVICDLLSGACNPAEIERLMQLGLGVKTLDRLHAKVWISRDHVIVGSANASRNGLPGEDESSANANIEAAVLSKDPSLSRKMTNWFEKQWRLATTVDDDHLAMARQLWERRRRSAGRAFTSTVIQKIRNPGPSDRFSQLRLIAYPEGSFSDEAEQFLRNEGRRHYSDEEWQAHGDDWPCYEWPLTVREWTPPPGTVLMDFTCSEEGGTFSFNGFWQVRDCPTVTLTGTQLTLLTKLPHFHGYPISGQDARDIAGRIRRFVAQNENRMDAFGSYIDMNFLEFWDSERPMLKQRLIAQVVEAARELCRSDQFDQSLTLRAIRVCKEDAGWLSEYTRYVGGDIYQHRNHLKQEINREIGRRVRAGVGATVVTDDNERRAREEVADEIIQSYTPLAGYDPMAVASR